MTDFDTVFRPHVAEATGWYTTRVLKLIDRLRDADGVIRHPGYGRGGGGYTQNRLALRYLRDVEGSGRLLAGSEMRIAGDFLAKEAEAFGEEQVASYIAKLRKKVDGIDAVAVTLRSNGEFTLTGTFDGRRVRIDQQVVFKVSTHGKFFLQWPARIYVDGKFTPERSFRSLVEGAA